MSELAMPGTVDLIRWTFSIDPDRRAEVERYLTDLGLAVQVRGDDLVVATWEEPAEDIDRVIEELWAIHGEPFEVTHEEFHCLDPTLPTDEEIAEGDCEAA